MNYILLPAYNEAQALPPLLEQIGNLDYPDMHVVAVDDGSNDGTADVIKSFKLDKPFTFLQHSQNQGLGKAMATGLAYLRTIMASDDTLTTLDADNTHSASHIPEMIEKIQEGYDMIIRSRYREGARQEGVPFHRQCLSLAVSYFLRVAAPFPGVRDYSCGFRTYSGSVLQKAWEHYGDTLVEEQGFACMTELLLKMSIFHPKILEMPLILRYDLKPTSSKMKITRTIYRYLVILKKIKKK